MAVVFPIALAIGYQEVGSVDRTLRSAAGHQELPQNATGHTRDMLISEAMTIILPGNAANHAGDVQTFRQTIAELGKLATTPAGRRDAAQLSQTAAGWIASDHRVIADAVAHRTAPAAALEFSVTNSGSDDLVAAVQDAERRHRPRRDRHLVLDRILHAHPHADPGPARAGRHDHQTAALS